MAIDDWFYSLISSWVGSWLFSGCAFETLLLSTSPTEHFPISNYLLIACLNTAYLLCKTDPLLLNELGIVAFHSTDYTAAIDFFRSALAFSAQNGADTPAKIPFWTNLAHALRRAGMLDDALSFFNAVLRSGVRDAAVWSILQGPLNGPFARLFTMRGL